MSPSHTLPRAVTSDRRSRQLVVLFVALYTLGLRVLPFAMSRWGFELNTAITYYPWNFSPMHALCLFGGMTFASRRFALLFPLGLHLLGDVLIALLAGPEMVSWGVTVLMCAAYLCCALCGIAGRRFPIVPGAILGGTLGCVLFFLITNFASWLMYDSFPHTSAGLLECYVAGLPFFRNTLISTAMFGGLLFVTAGATASEATVPRASAMAQ